MLLINFDWSPSTLLCSPNNHYYSHSTAMLSTMHHVIVYSHPVDSSGNSLNSRGNSSQPSIHSTSLHSTSLNRCHYSIPESSSRIPTTTSKSPMLSQYPNYYIDSVDSHSLPLSEYSLIGIVYSHSHYSPIVPTLYSIPSMQIDFLIIIMQSIFHND